MTRPFWGRVPTFYLLSELFDAARQNPNIGMNAPGRLIGRHCVARKLKAQAKRRKGRVKANVRHKAGRAVYTPD